MMTVQEYKDWKATRGDDAAQWDHATCIAADQLVKFETLGALAVILRKGQVDRAIADYVQTMVRCHFGSAETDELLVKLHAYPAWI